MTSHSRQRVIVSWSGGKDCCMALRELRRSADVEVAGLLTTVGKDDGLIAMHGISRQLIEAQAAALCLPVTFAELPANAPNPVYEQVLARALAPIADAGVRAVAFGDLFLGDIRRYREDLMARLGFAPIFPVWARDTREFADEFIDAGYRAIVVAVDSDRLAPAFAGRAFDSEFLAALPAGVDPCGENGEFHSFVVSGPDFLLPVDVKLGSRLVEDKLTYQRLIPR